MRFCRPRGSHFGALPVVQAIMMLDEAEENARLGKHQYLSGVLHNVAKILIHESMPTDPIEALQDLGFSFGWCQMATSHLCVLA